MAGGTAGGRAPLLQWGGAGSDPGKFNRPSGIATASGGDVYVTDKQNYRVQRFGPAGEFRGQWGSFGNDNGMFRFPHGIAVDAAGAVYVTDLVNNEVQKFDGAGSFVRRWDYAGPPYNATLDPINIAAGRENTVYVTTEDNYVYRFNSNGQVLTRWGSGPFGTHDPGDLHEPDGIATDATGNVYVTQDGADRVEKFAFDGAFLDSWGGPGAGEGQFAHARGITHTPSGSVFAADSGNHRVQEFTPTGTFTSQFGSRGASSSQFEFPVAIAADCRSRLYVVDEGNNRILVFGDPQGPPPPCSASPGPSKPVAGASELVIDSAAGKFRATLVRSALTRGKLSQAGARVAEKGIAARGRFRGSLGRKRRGLSMLAPFTRGGTWRTRFDVTADLLARSGTARGYTLAIARKKTGGRVCLKFSTRFRVVGAKLEVTGSFRALGGTRAGAGLVASGRFKQAYKADESFTLSGTGKARKGRKRGLPAQCRRLARAR